MTTLDITLIVVVGYLFAGILSQFLCAFADRTQETMAPQAAAILALIWPAYWIVLMIDHLRHRCKEKSKWKYIPKDLDDAIRMLKKNLSANDMQQLKRIPESKMALYHHGFGRMLRNEWGLWKKSRLAEWFNEQGVHHADDMSSTILTSLWRQVHKEPIRLDEQVAKHKAYWEGMEEDNA